jgi:hypothetical protein
MGNEIIKSAVKIEPWTLIQKDLSGGASSHLTSISIWHLDILCCRIFHFPAGISIQFIPTTWVRAVNQ